MRGEGNFREGLVLPELKEYTKAGGLQKNFFSMDFEKNDKDVVELKERIEKFEGVVRIMVHPLFEHNEPKRHEYYPRAELTEQGLKTLIEKDAEQTPAMFVFEEYVNMEKTQEYLKPSIEKSRQPVYYIPTSEKTPLPVYDKEGKIGSSGKTNFEKWDEVYKKLQQLGVKKAIIGGIILSAYDNDTRDIPRNFAKSREEKGAKEVPYKLLGCVGRVVTELSRRGMDVEISNFFSDSDKNKGYYTDGRMELAKKEKLASPNHPHEDVK